ncbi:MAG: hypothetical protein RI958_1002 [Actinomycetota bacterium]|jgi:hypothetical protein
MTDQVLDVLKYAFLALLYLFFARVLWAVWSEVRGPRPGHAVTAPPTGTPAPPDPADATLAAAAPDPKQLRKASKHSINRLVVLEPRERRGATFLLNTEMRIGRSPQCAVSIPDDAFVSQIHARLYISDNVSWVEDLNSTNGTYLNGARVEGARPIVKGDRLQIGATIWEAN